MNCPHCQAENPSGDAVCFECGRPLAAITKGSVIADRYEVLGVLGRGGMGVVYQAHDRLLDESVAIKVLKRELLAEPEAARRFRNEIKLARRVSHPNVCRIHEYGEHGGVSYISMAFVPGHDVRQRLAEFPNGLPAEEAFDVAIQAARGLQAIHDVGVVHRDFKTPNIMREPDGAIRLMDFGIAKATTEGSGRLTATGMVVGTPEFMSPEQCRGLAVDARSDIYALGVVIFELFTGHVPFQGDSLMATLLKHTEEPPPLEGPGSEGLPPGVVPVLRKALAKLPEERWSRASDVAVALEAARAQAAGAPPPAVAAAPPVPAPAVAPPATPHAGRERRRSVRLELPLDISIKKLGPEGAVLAQERTLADNLSRTGLRVVTALDSVAPGDVVLVQEIAGDFQARAHVRHRFRASDGVWRLGLEFIDAEAPDRLVRTGDWTSNVSARPRARTPTPVPAPAAPASAPPLPAGRDRRSSSRIAIPLELTLERLSPGGQVLQQERTLAENVGWGGAQVLTAMSSLNVGDVVRVTEQGGDFQTRAAVRNAHTGPDRIRRLNLEFLDRQAPDRLVPASMTPAGGTRQVPPAGATPRPAPGPPTSASAPRLAPAAPAVTPRQAPSASMPAAAAPAGPGRGEVLELFAALKTRTHFEVLGLERSASATQVREAYGALVRRFHPDAARAADVTDLQAELGAIMARLAEAQRVLTDVKRRSDYEAYLGPVRRPGPAPAAPTPAAPGDATAPEPPRPEPAYPVSIEPKVREALELLKQEKNWDAIQLLEKALPQAQTPVQRHLVQLHLARAVIKNPKWLKRGEELLLEITRENPRHVEALLQLAGIYKGQSLRTRAERTLRKVLELDPGNGAASAALDELVGGAAG